MLNRIRSVICAVTLASCLMIPAAGCASRTVMAPPPPISADTAWTQFQDDLCNSGATIASAPVSMPGVGWKQQVGNGTMAGVNVVPLVAGDRLFVLDALGMAWAFDSKTGERKWTAQLSSTGMQFQLATPAYDSGRLYVATNDGRVYALDAATGKILWCKKMPLASEFSQLNTPVKCAGGKVYVGGWNPDAKSVEYYYCLNAANGRPGIGRSYRMPNTASPGGYYWTGGCVAGRCLVFGSEQSCLTCLDKDTGALLDRVDLKTIVPGAKENRSSVSYDPASGMLFLTDQARNEGCCWAFGLDAATGKLTHRWHTRLGFSTSTPAIYNNMLYVGTGIYSLRGGVHCLDESTGREIWKYIPDDPEKTSMPGVQASPTISVQNGVSYIYFTTIWENSSVICLDQNGKPLWEFRDDTATYTLQGVAVAGGWLYFGNDFGWVYALKPTASAPVF